MVMVRSLRTEILMVGGSHCASSGSTALMRSTVSMTLASACLKTMTSTAWLVPAQPASVVVFNPFDDLAEGVQLDGNAVPLGENQVLIIRGVEQLVVADDGVGDCCAIQAALGLIHIDLAEKGADLFQTDAGGGQGGGIDLDPHGGFCGAADDGLADALDLAEFLADDVVPVLEYVRRAAGCRRSWPGS